MSSNFSGTSGERRISLRAPVSIEADLRQAGRTAFKVLVRDLSRTGCRAETLSKTNVGNRVWVTLPGFAPVEGEIVWANKSGFAVHWRAALHASVFDHIRQRFPEMFR